MPTTRTDTMDVTVRVSPSEPDKLELTVRPASGGDINALLAKMLVVHGARALAARHLSGNEAVQLTLGRNDAMILSGLLQAAAYNLPTNAGAVDGDCRRGTR